MHLYAGNLIDGHILASDWLLLIAAIIFIAAAVVVVAVERKTRPWLDWSALTSVGLAAVAVALLVV
jgi:hypothetical protein